MQFKKLYIVLLTVSIVGTSTIAQPLTNCRLFVAWEDWKPYIYKENGQFKGSEYFYLIKLAKNVGCKLHFVEEPWARSLNSLKNGTVDILYGASYTKERDAFAEFSVPERNPFSCPPPCMIGSILTPFLL